VVRSGERAVAVPVAIFPLGCSFRSTWMQWWRGNLRVRLLSGVAGFGGLENMLKGGMYRVLREK